MGPGWENKRACETPCKSPGRRAAGRTGQEAPLRTCRQPSAVPELRCLSAGPRLRRALRAARKRCGWGGIIGSAGVIFCMTQTEKHRLVVLAEGCKLWDQARSIPWAERVARCGLPWRQLRAA